MANKIPLFDETPSQEDRKMKRLESIIGLAMILSLAALVVGAICALLPPRIHPRRVWEVAMEEPARAGPAAHDIIPTHRVSDTNAMPSCGTTIAEGSEAIVNGGGATSATKKCFCRAKPMIGDAGYALTGDAPDGGRSNAPTREYQWCSVVWTDAPGYAGAMVCYGGTETVCP